MSHTETIDLIFGDTFKNHQDKIPKDTRDIKKSLRLEQDTNGVQVIAVAVSNDETKNKVLDIPTSTGTPLNTEVHNLVRDSYHVEGVDFYEIGPIPVNYRITIDGTPWEADIPLPYTVIRRYLSAAQIKSFDDWRSKYKADEFDIEYLQILGVY